MGLLVFTSSIFFWRPIPNRYFGDLNSTTALQLIVHIFSPKVLNASERAHKQVLLSTSFNFLKKLIFDTPPRLKQRALRRWLVNLINNYSIISLIIQSIEHNGHRINFSRNNLFTRFIYTSLILCSFNNCLK